jgi:hypothetical protein
MGRGDLKSHLNLDRFQEKIAISSTTQVYVVKNEHLRADLNGFSQDIQFGCHADL